MASSIKYTPHYTVAEYLQWEGDWELYDGIPVSMSPSPSLKHQQVAGKLFNQIFNSLSLNEACRCSVVYETDWHVNQFTALRPDISVLCGDREGDFIASPPTLIIEVHSPSTEERDRVVKREIYQNAGVPIYLQLNPQDHHIKCLALREKGYEDVYFEGFDLRLTLHEGCELNLDLKGLFEG